VLASDAYADAVRADERQAQAYGITAVPFFVVDRRYGVAGAQPPEALLEVLDTAWAEAQPPQVLSPAADAGARADGSCNI
jgi:predicted DsbA family dithiol-disulfide isomerase